MADKRAYFKLDVGYMSNPKVLTVLDESPTSVLLHIASIGYAAQHLTNGIVPVRALLRITGAGQDDADRLLASGLWVEHPGGKAEIHDYLEHQRSADEVKGASEKAKRAASARWNASSNASSMPDALQSASETPMPREKREEREKDTSSSDLFDEFWTIYPRREGKGAARKAWAKAVKAIAADELLPIVRSYAVRTHGTEPRFIPFPATWLNQERWADEVTTQEAESSGEWFQPFRVPECPPEIADDPERYEGWLQGRREAWQAGERW